MNGTKHARSLSTWTVPQSPFVIEYLPEVLEDIRMAVLAAYHALSHGGLEIGGLLLGSRFVDRVSITDFRPLECEHAFGPSFRLSPDDDRRMSAAIAEAQAAGQTVVGWFHSHTRTAIFLSEADLEIHNRHFGQSWQVALVLKPVVVKPTLCGFFFREADGSIHSEGSYREFELGSKSFSDQPEISRSLGLEAQVKVPVAAPSRHGPSPEAVAPPDERLKLVKQASPTDGNGRLSHETASVPDAPADLKPWEVSAAAQPWQKSRGLHIHRTRLLVGAAIVLSLIAVYRFFNRPDSETPATPQQSATVQAAAADKTLGLKLQRLGSDLILTWDRNASDTLGATAGLLSVKDGPLQKEMGLNVAQLRSAIFLVTPDTNQVEVQLTMLLPNQRTASESAIVSLPAPEPVARVAVGKAAPSNNNVIAQSPSNNNVIAQLGAKPQRLRFTKTFVAPKESNHAPQTQLTDEPPALTGVGPAERTQPPPLASIRTFTINPPPPATGGEEKASAQTISQDGASPPSRAGGNAQPAAVISRTSPIYPFAARSGHLRGSVVLEGLVGTNGRVKELKVVSGIEAFRQAALDAVTQWVYKPALLNGKAVEAHVHVEINFREAQ